MRFYYTKLEEGRERWRSRLERLQEECSEERKAVREQVSRLTERAEGAEAAARRAAGVREDKSAGLRASLSAEFAQVEAKVAAVLGRKTEQADALKERLTSLQGQTKAREEELSDHRRRTFS
ncbi:hypothetical protein Esi_0103_0075 [Ectocarpus siliculosus]|uniref:Uncharacterized protein n=1 Tax=Ectocarpus siliculosus TaxID=2880 RepID=D8LCH6_ECTSI|nr:hypothetical protein Esi_0103_0075 [Ectocarpus siliculosus]|eukprot:CBN78212.1 hypothetical protein Esi_0103_0075 [Ectocarpus siliculosus]